MKNNSILMSTRQNVARMEITSPYRCGYWSIFHYGCYLWFQYEHTFLFPRKIQEVIEEFNTVHCINVEDWNVVLTPDLDTMNDMHLHNPRAREVVFQLMDELTLFDVWRIFHPTGF